jgi:hypothetical protein
VILKAADAPRVAGKFLLGRPVLDAARLVLAFDDQAAFHKDIAAAHGLRPLGGGWCEIVDRARAQRGADPTLLSGMPAAVRLPGGGLIVYSLRGRQA